MSLRPDHDARALRSLMERFNSVAQPLSPADQAAAIRQQLAESAPDVMRHPGDTTIRVVKRAGKPIGEIGVDSEASPGNGQYYVKLYDGSYDAVGFDSAEEALAELKSAIKQMSKGVTEGSANANETPRSQIIKLYKKGLEDYDIAYDLDIDEKTVADIIDDYDKKQQQQYFKKNGVTEAAGLYGPFTVTINTGERPQSRTKTKRFKREDDAVLWAEDWLENYPQYSLATAKVTDPEGNVVWTTDESEGVAEAKPAARKRPLPKFTAYPNYAAWRQELMRRGDDQIDHLDNDSVDNYRVLFAVDRNRQVVGMYYHTADSGSFVPAGQGFSDMIYYADTDPNWPYTGDDGREDLPETAKKQMRWGYHIVVQQTGNRAPGTPQFKTRSEAVQYLRTIPVERRRELEVDEFQMREGIAEGVNEKQIKRDLDSGMSTDAVIGKHANKKLTNTDEIRRVIQRHAQEKRKKKVEEQRVSEGRAGIDDTDTVGFSVNSEAAYTAVMRRFGDAIDHDETSGVMSAPARLWPQIEMTAFDADPDSGATRVEDDMLDEAEYGGIDIDMEKDGDEITVRASAGGKQMGHVLFVDSGEYLMPQDLEVDERFRGQGIAAIMYDYVKSQGYKIRRSGQQTDDGAAFWDKNRPGQNVWEQGVAEAEKKPHPNTWHDVDPKLGRAVDKMSQAEKVKKGLAHPDTLKKKGVAEGVTSPEIKQAYDAAMKTEPNTPERKRAVAHYQKLRADALAKKKQSGVAETNKHSVIGKIQRGHELKKKVDQSYRDIGAAQQAGDKAAGSRAFRKHERLANLERPGTWTKPKDLSENSAPTEKVSSIIKRVMGKQLQWEPGVSKLYKNTRRSKTQRVDDYVMKYISTGIKLRGRLSANSGDAVAVALKKQLIQAGYPVYDDVLIFPDQIMFQVRTPISVTAESAAGKQK